MRSSLRVLTWNVFMMVPSWIHESPRNRERASVIADVLREQDYDVICLQKVFDGSARDILEAKLSPCYPYRFGPANDACSLKLNSGVWVLSRIPLSGYRDIEFDACGGIECLSRKGAILLFGMHDGVPFRLIVTHLQGEEGLGIRSDRIRADQIATIRDRLILPHVEPGAPFIICGDLNTARFTRRFHRENPSYVAMLRSFGAENGGEERITLDDSGGNALSRDRTGRRSELDYILVRPAGRDVHVLRERKMFQRGGWDDKRPERLDLSYRYAVSATIAFSAPAT